jgi:hypothetical protein
MPRLLSTLVFTVTSLACALALSACADSPSEHKHPPVDPPDYKGVPTDMTPPSMIDNPAPPKSGSQPQ